MSGDSLKDNSSVSPRFRKKAHRYNWALFVMRMNAVGVKHALSHVRTFIIWHRGKSLDESYLVNQVHG